MGLAQPPRSMEDLATYVRTLSFGTRNKTFLGAINALALKNLVCLKLTVILSKFIIYCQTEAYPSGLVKVKHTSLLTSEYKLRGKLFYHIGLLF
jgi:hypothetical protein